MEGVEHKEGGREREEEESGSKGGSKGMGRKKRGVYRWTVVTARRMQKVQ